jgi:hypothetical protein
MQQDLESKQTVDTTVDKSSKTKDAADRPATSIWDFDPSPEALGPGEFWWRDHYQWLKDAGYLLRPRYDPAWIPSWRGTKKDWLDCEDSKALWVREHLFCVLDLAHWTTVHQY